MAASSTHKSILSIYYSSAGATIVGGVISIEGVISVDPMGSGASISGTILCMASRTRALSCESCNFDRSAISDLSCSKSTW